MLTFMEHHRNRPSREAVQILFVMPTIALVAIVLVGGGALYAGAFGEGALGVGVYELFCAVMFALVASFVHKAELPSGVRVLIDIDAKEFVYGRVAPHYLTWMIIIMSLPFITGKF